MPSLSSLASTSAISKELRTKTKTITKTKILRTKTKKLKQIGFYSGKKSNVNIYRFFASTEKETKSGDIHIHLVKIDSDRYKDFLILKEYLLMNKEERKAYAKLKKEILKDGYNIREDYKNIKSKYVTDLLNRARENVK